MVKQIASWNSQNQVWITANQNQLLEQWVLWQEVWPKSGMTVSGSLFELVMPAHLIGESESSFSQLPTLKARDSQAEGYEAGLRRSQPQIGTVVKAIVDGDDRLLRTPSVVDSTDGAISERQARDRGMPGVSLGVAVRMETLPTPTTRDWKDSQAPHKRDGVVQTDTVARAVFNSGEIELSGTPRATASESSASQVAAGATKGRIEDQVLTTNWGKFEPAIRRWEQHTRPAPAPTKPDGKDGNHRLSSLFTEWMMGLPDGWVTGHGLKRNDELKMCGNGVVPQQAELALRYLLQQVELEKATSES